MLPASGNVALVKRDRPIEQRHTAVDTLTPIGLQHGADHVLGAALRRLAPPGAQRPGSGRRSRPSADRRAVLQSGILHFTSADLLVLVYRRVLEGDNAAMFVSYDVREVAGLCDRVVVMDESPGQMLAELVNPLPHDERESHPGALTRFEDQVMEAHPPVPSGRRRRLVIRYALITTKASA